MISFLLTTAPMRSASVSAFAFVRLASSTSTSPLLAAALASAPPIFPVPIKPIFIICRVLSTPIRSPSAALYRTPPLFSLSVKDISTPAALSSTAPANHPFKIMFTAPPLRPSGPSLAALAALRQRTGPRTQIGAPSPIHLPPHFLPSRAENRRQRRRLLPARGMQHP